MNPVAAGQTMSHIYTVTQLFRGRDGNGLIKTWHVDDQCTEPELGERLFNTVIEKGWIVEHEEHHQHPGEVITLPDGYRLAK